MEAIPRADFNRQLVKALAAGPFMSISDWNEALGVSAPIRYGFTTDRTSARRQPTIEAASFSSYQKGALLRFRKVWGDDDQFWGQIFNDPNLAYPKRPLAVDPIYVPIKNIQELTADKTTPIGSEIPVANKRIEITLSWGKSLSQHLVAYQGSEIFLTSTVTAGLRNYTRRGEFTTLYRTRARYMQGSDYDLPGVPFVVYFTEQGHALHGAYWRKSFGTPGSHGCINLPTEKANLLWRWASEPGVRVIVHD